MLSLPAGSRLFQSTRPRGARQTTSFGDLMAERVSIHAPARGATGNLVGLLAAKECFNPRAREGRDIANRAVESRELVSIHAPARGATKEKHYELNRQDCFNPRAREGRDKSARSLTAAKECFNPRAREGRDLFEGCFCGKKTFQSTRPRGARRRGAAGAAGSKRFNPRAREGRDTPRLRGIAWWSAFQSTRPRGARRRSGRASGCLSQFQSTRPRGARQPEAVRLEEEQSFNPRAREGRDPPSACSVEGCLEFQSTRPRGARRERLLACARSLEVSIHAPARGATTEDSTIVENCQCFNPRAREGRDHTVFLPYDNPPKVSIHAPARGATYTRSFQRRGGAFQSTRPRGARRCLYRSAQGNPRFNPRAREGRDRH